MQVRSYAAPFATAALVLLSGLVVGCGGDKLGHVSGKVTFGGKPVPAGSIQIQPDGSKGNVGPSGYAEIKDGKYDTQLSGGKAAKPGPVIFAVEGIDPVPPPGAAPDVTTTVLFPRYEVSGELPPATSIKDIEVPLTAAKVTRPSGPGP